MDRLKKKLNVIMIVVDGARIDRINKSKKFASVIKQGTTFTNMFTYAPYTLASMGATFSGIYGIRNGVDAYNKMYNYSDNVKFLAEYFKDNGWYTRGDTMRLSIVPGRGFDKLTSQDESTENTLSYHKKIIQSLSNNKNSPFFLYLHYSDIHNSMVEDVFNVYDDFSEEYFSNLDQNKKNYDRYITDAGDYLDNLFSEIKRLKLFDNSLILVMADHGMGYGEKVGERAYGVYTYDYSIRSFATFINAEMFNPNQQINKLTRTVDILPTILHFVGINKDKSYLEIDGKSLKDYLLPPSIFRKIKNIFDRRISFSETGGVYGPWPSPGKPNVKCVRDDNWKLIHNLQPDTWELYNIIKDSSETLNLVSVNKKKFESMKKIMEDIISN